MDINIFHTQLYTKLEEIHDYITTNVKSTGDIEEDCQQLTILNALNKLEMTIDGTEEQHLETV